jgi:chitinase
MPSSCTWRGGETGCGRHGQWYAGKVTLFHSQHGFKSCCKPGWQAFCCQSNTWSSLVDACLLLRQGLQLPGRQVPRLVALRAQLPGHARGVRRVREAGVLLPGRVQVVPLDRPGLLRDENERADWEIEMLTDSQGDSYRGCSTVINRRRILYCKPPEALNAFLPASMLTGGGGGATTVRYMIAFRVPNESLQSLPLSSSPPIHPRHSPRH